MTLFALAFLVGLDNLQVAAAIGILPLGRGKKWRLAVAFGLCEGSMPLLGLLLGHQLQRINPQWFEAAGPIALLVCGAAIIILALREIDVEQAAGDNKWLLYGLPLSLSLDNFIAGIALGTLGYPLLLSAVTIGLMSTGLCLAGLYGTALMGRWLPGEMGTWSGVFLVVLGLVRW